VPTVTDRRKEIDMPRPEKVAAVSEIKDRFAGAQAVFLAEYAGLSVKAQQALRRSLKAQGAEFQVVKMTLARRAADELELAELDGLLVGPTGLTFADGDAVAAAKVLKDFAAANEVFTIKGGLLGTTVLTPERIRQLADIEPREVLLAKLAGLFKAPTAAMAGLLAAMPRGAATVLHALVDRKTAEEPAPPVEPTPEPAPEATGDEAAAGAAEAVEDQPAEGEQLETEDAAADGPEDAAADEPEADEIAEATGATEAAAAEDSDNEETEIEDQTAAEAEEEN
jgi:large subunit ribosomal protein L10